MTDAESRGDRRHALVAVVSIGFFASFAVGWFHPPSLVGVGDWDWYFSDAWVSASALLERRLPGLWSIQLAGGVPLAADPESLSHSPFLVLPLICGPIVGIKLLVVALLASGLIGCYRLGRRWLGDPLGAAVFAFAFVFSGHFAIHLRAGHFPWAVFYLVPWILLYADRLLFEPRLRRIDSSGFVVSLALLVTGPLYHALVFFLLPVAIVYGAASARRASKDRVLHVALLALCTMGIAMPRLLAIVDWEWRNPRTVPGYGGMPLGVIARMLFLPIADYKDPVTWGASGVWEYWSYVGVVTLVLALRSLLIRGWPRAFAVACAATAVLLAWRSPEGNPLAWIAPHVPFLLSARIYSRFLVVAVFALALAAGSGAAALRGSVADRSVSGRLGLRASLALLLLALEYGLVIRPIWCRVFELPPAEVYPDWGITLAEPRYRSIRTAPPYEGFTADRDMFISRMLPLLMSGAIVRNAYVTMALPWGRPPEGATLDWPADRSTVTNDEMDIFGDLRPGREIAIHLHYTKRYWKVTDPEVARIAPDAAGMKLVILEPCHRVRIVVREHGETIGWAVSALALSCLVWLIRRDVPDEEPKCAQPSSSSH